jgi:hypothetical protein
VPRSLVSQECARCRCNLPQYKKIYFIMMSLEKTAIAIVAKPKIKVRKNKIVVLIVVSLYLPECINHDVLGRLNPS